VLFLHNIIHVASILGPRKKETWKLPGDSDRLRKRDRYCEVPLYVLGYKVPN